MTKGTGRLTRPTLRYRLALERLEDRALPSTSAWLNFGHDSQHTGDSPVAAQPIDSIHWSAPVDLNPTGSAVHYGSPIVTPANTIIIPVKTGANGGFELTARNGATGQLLWTITSDYTLPPFNWMPPFGPALTPGNRLYFPGNGGTVYYVNNPDSAGATISGQVAFYGIDHYNKNPSAFNSSVMIDTPITADTHGNIYFGFQVTGSNPLNLTGGGVGRISAGGHGSYVLASAAVNDTYGLTPDYVPLSSAPVLSQDGSTLYVSLANSSSAHGYLVGLDSTTLATKYQTVLLDPRNNGNYARMIIDSTATPMVGPDGTVFYGVFGSPYNGSRGFLLHFSADLLTEYTPGAFGWDDTPSVVPASMIPQYHGTSSYLVFSKYNNYVAGETGSSGGDGVNEVAVLDPYASQPDTRNDGDPSLQVMNEVLTMSGPTPDTYWVQNGYPNAVREWCINDTAVDPSTKSIFVNSEDGSVYRWYLPTNTLTEGIDLTTGIGEPYVPTLIGPDGTVFALNGGTVFALGGLPNYTLTDTASVNPAAVGASVTFTATLASTNGGPTPGGTVDFMDGSTTLQTVNVVNGQASYTATELGVANHRITAAYSGESPTYVAGSTLLIESVRYNDTPVVTSSQNPSVANQPVTLTVTVSPVSPGTATPTGNVVFLDGTALLGYGTLNASGQASITTSSLSVGKHHIRAVYSGDFEYVPTKSVMLVQRVNPGADVVLGTWSRNVAGRPVTPPKSEAPAELAVAWTPLADISGREGGAAVVGAALGHVSLATYGSARLVGPNPFPAFPAALDRFFASLEDGLA
jgi:hypothetical protein